MKISVDVHQDKKRNETITIVRQEGKDPVITFHTFLTSEEITSEQAIEKMNKYEFNNCLNLHNLQINL